MLKTYVFVPNNMCKVNFHETNQTTTYSTLSEQLFNHFLILLSHSWFELSLVSNNGNNFPSPSIFGKGLNTYIMPQYHDVFVQSITSSRKCPHIGWIWTCQSYHQSKQSKWNKTKTIEMKLKMGCGFYISHTYNTPHHMPHILNFRNLWLILWLVDPVANFLNLLKHTDPVASKVLDSLQQSGFSSAENSRVK
jgi:hypothetical protein